MIHNDPTIHGLSGWHPDHPSDNNGIDPLDHAHHGAADLGGPLTHDLIADPLGLSEHLTDGENELGVTADDGVNHHIAGTPDIDSRFWRQQTIPIDCAAMCNRGIIHEFTGVDVPEAQLVFEATKNHWLTEDGTAPCDISRLLEYHGVECHPVDHGNIADLFAELAAGHKVIVAVNADDLWDANHPLHDFGHQAADHAIWVTGVDATDPEHVKVIINDSGDPNGCGCVYELDTFLHAWHASGFAYVATDHAPPGFADHVTDFDTHEGVFAGLVHSIREHMPEFLAAGGILLASSMTNNTTKDQSMQESFKKLLGPIREAQSLLPPPMALLTRAERDRILDDN